MVEALNKELPENKVKKDYILAPLTTLKIGGPADVYLHSTSNRSLGRLLTVLNQNSILPIILGNGSNVLISDSGIRGVVLRNSDSSIEILGQHQSILAPPKLTTQRHEDNPQNYLDFTKIDYDESDSPVVQVKISSGTPLPYALNHLLDRGITGLQWFAYIPGTVGGAVVYNLHGGNYHLNQFLDSVTYFDLQTGQSITTPAAQLNWDYDTSEFQTHPHWIVLEATFNLFKGDANRARKTAHAWMAQKAKVQPMNSAGSVFQNPTLEQCLPLWGEQKSTGWIIDQVLGLKGLKIGGAQIGPQHANIFTNQGKATSADFLALVDKVKSAAKSKLGLDLNLEIKLLGF